MNYWSSIDNTTPTSKFQPPKQPLSPKCTPLRMTHETHPAADQSSPKHTGKRTNTACLRCRERKVRCSGTCPCANCTRRSTECVFEQEDKKIMVSERLLNDLKRKAEILDASPPVKHRRISSTRVECSELSDEFGGEPANASEEDGLPQMKNPLTTTPSKFVTDASGRRRFLGPSSTWAYSRQVMGMIRQYLNQDASPQVPLNIDGAAFALEFPSMKQLGGTIPMDNLPSLDYAIYLTNTVKFHISQTYHLFDEQSFLSGLFALYNEGPRPLNPKSRLWYVQYFILMAFGKALLVRGVSASSPPGRDYFFRAMEMFPDVDGLYQDPILSIEICCGLALYLQSVDHRNSAYTYLGLGLRIALSQGLHRDLAGETQHQADTTRERSTWWTLYILDRKLSSLMGAPNSVHDDDISVPLPKAQQCMQESTALQVHLKVSRLIAKVLNTVYGIDGRLDASFLRNVQAMLQQLAILAQEINAAPELKLDPSTPLSRVSATLNLGYHQCIVLATRPLLMCLLRERLEMKARGDKNTREMREPVKALLKASCDSANQSLRILSSLHSQDLLETFLPFDLDHAFSASFVLSLISAIQPFPDLIDDSFLEVTSDLLKTLIASGNIPARFRLEELDRLHDMLLLVNQQGMDPLLHPELEQRLPGLHAEQNNNNSSIPQGISPRQMSSVASLLESYPGLDLSSIGVDNSWLWEGDMPEFV